MVRLAEAPRPGAFNALGPDYSLSMAALLYGVRATTSAGATLRWVPAATLEKLGVQAWSDLPVWVPGSGDSAGFARRSNRKAVAAGLRFRPLANTAADTLDWFRSLPDERQAHLGAGLSDERERRLLAALDQP
jgi:2'-hydroxyisoflavone reductase